VAPSQTSRYSITCTGAGGTSDAKTATVTVSSGSKADSDLTFGETSILGGVDSGNAGIVEAQNATLSQTATVRSLSFYIRSGSGSIRLGIYDASGPNGNPGKLLAQTASVSAVRGWNTANVTAPVTLPAGTYWLAYEVSNDSLGFNDGITSGVRNVWASQSFGSLPTTFSTDVDGDRYHFSLYASFDTKPLPPAVSFSASSASLTSGDSATLTWSSTNATSCEGTGFTANGTSGSVTVTPTHTATYAVTCTGAGGSDAKSAIISVSTPIVSTVKIGETTRLGGVDSGNAGIIEAQNATLSQAATIQSISFYIGSGTGHIRLGIYDASGPNGNPGKLLAQTASVSAVRGWNTANVTAPVTLPAGTYWISYEIDSNTLTYNIGITSGIRNVWASQSFGSLPETFPTGIDSDRYHFSLYATLGSQQVASAAFTQTLALGSSGPEVSFLQNLLGKFGYFTGAATGYFGTLTEQAVRSFQGANQLAAVGSVGPLTRGLLNAIGR
jgi:peptidoglycan hydrolase-like protein with peptidoglycan-binding domain